MPGFIERGASMAYGLFNLGLFTLAATLDGSVFGRTTKKDKEELAEAQDRLWSLNATPFGLRHKFFTLRDGNKLHYVEKVDATPKSKLVIFIHGFPDSWVLWQELLSSSRLAQDATLIGVDLPGYGGSDDLPNLSAETVLEAMTQFILGMRELHSYAEETGPEKVLVVGHDWGAIVAFRLAADAPVLADRFVIASAIFPRLALANTKNRFATAKQMLRTYLHHPFSFGLLRKAMSSVSPVLGQASKSGYVFTFQLPTVFSNFFGRMGNFWFLRTIHRIGRWKKKLLTGPEAAEAMAQSVGPGAAECHPKVQPKDASTGETLSYPTSVAKRISTWGWHNKLRIYRDGLILSNWTKSLETLLALSTLEGEGQSAASPQSPRRPSATGLFDTGPKGALKAPATVVYGMKDPAFETRLGLEGMGDYLTRGSQVVLLEKGGHWLPLEKKSNDVLEEIILWSLEGEKVPLGSSLAIALEQSVEGVKIAIDM